MCTYSFYGQFHALVTVFLYIATIFPDVKLRNDDFVLING